MVEMIEDQELRELFQIESDEHLQIIEKGLLELEKNPKDYDTIHLIFREAHSMKGASRMLGISDIESIAHIFEEVLGKASRGEFEITPNLIDVYYEGLDAIKKLVHEAVTGERTQVDVIAVLDRLISNKVEDTKPTLKSSVITAVHEKKDEANEIIKEDVKEVIKKEVIKKEVKEVIKEDSLELQDKEIQVTETQKAAPQTIVEDTQTEAEKDEIDKIIESKRQSIVNTPVHNTTKEVDAEKKPIAGDSKKIDTMRVEPAKLDMLMVQTGELIVTKNRISSRVKEISEIQYLQQELLRTVNETKKLINQFNKEEHINPKTRFLTSQLTELVNKQSDKYEQIENNLSDLKKTLSHDVARLNHTSLKIERSIYNIRMLSLSTVFNLFHRTVRDLSRETGKNVQLIIEGGDTTIDKQILEELKDPLMHLIRNAIDHGIETNEERIELKKPDSATVQLVGKSYSDSVVIEIKDDGKGIDIERVKSKALEKGLYTKEELSLMDSKRIYSILFHHGFSTRSEVSSLSGRGVGMDVVKSFVEKFKGDIETDSKLGEGTTFRLRLPTKFSTTHILIVSVEGQKFGIPTDYVILSRTIHEKDIFLLESRNTVLIENEPVYIVPLSSYLEINKPQIDKNTKSYPSIVISSNGLKIAVTVDLVIEKNEVIVKAFDGILKRVRNVTGVTILDSGEICVVLNPKDLVETILSKNLSLVQIKKEEDKVRGKILIADDSLTTRVQIKRILELEGFEVELA
ncbi:MAG: chemotaxis protein CheA, partial [Leptospiraceae bacterium]|nr:chemotaxis protein CheA [Leptospiraceae bacterium]